MEFNKYYIVFFYIIFFYLFLPKAQSSDNTSIWPDVTMLPWLPVRAHGYRCIPMVTCLYAHDYKCVPTVTDVCP